MDSSLYEAIRKGCATSAEDALTTFKDRIDEAQRTPNNNTVLHVAATFGRWEMVAKILQLCPSLLMRANSKGETALHIAAKGGHLKAVQALLDWAKKRDDGEILHSDCESGISSLAKEMLRTTDKVGDTALHMALRNRHDEIVQILVKEDPQFQCPPNEAMETPLYLAAECGLESCLEKIVKTCTSRAYTGPCGRNALHAAAIFNYQGCVKLLLDWKQALAEEEDDEGWSPLHHAAKNGSVEAVRQILKANKSEAYRHAGGKHNDGEWTTVVHIAARHDRIQVLKEIFSHCPDCSEMVNSKSQNFLHVAIQNNKAFTLRYGVRSSAFHHLIDEKDCDGNTPIHLLAASNCRPWSLGRHPRANMKTYNKQNMTPRDMLYGDESKKNRVRPSVKVFLSRYGVIGRRRQVKMREDMSAKVQKEAKKSKDGLTETHVILATLVATVTFAAGFTLPGGYNSSSPEAGKAILSRDRAFQAFVVTNTIALMCSIAALFQHFYNYFEKHRRRYYTISFESGLVLVALFSMMLAFVTGSYAVLSNATALAITICLIGCFAYLMWPIRIVIIP